VRILFSTWGPAGDLFPLIPIAGAAEAGGDETLFAVPRTLGLYLRALGIPAFALGSGSEARAVTDSEWFSPRFRGWSSWRTVWERYVVADLGESVDSAERIIHKFAPDVVATTTFAVAARIAAERCGVRTVNLSIYPQHAQRADSPRRSFAPTYLAAVRSTVARSVASSDDLAGLAWGVDRGTIWLHDRAVLQSSFGEQATVVGFPYWDSAIPSPGALATGRAFVREGAAPVLVTLGSFIGLDHADVIREAVLILLDAGHRCLVVGARADVASTFGADRRVCAIPFTPLSELTAGCRFLVHHGGIGTTFAAMSAGQPSVVIPQAYDQFFNAQLVEALGAGVDASAIPITDAISQVDSDCLAIQETVARQAQQLVPPERAAQRALEAVTGRGAP
jgi:UDP:flavonoid glycosyltransferase YjiC (YdhE family)